MEDGPCLVGEKVSKALDVFSRGTVRSHSGSSWAARLVDFEKNVESGCPSLVQEISFFSFSPLFNMESANLFTSDVCCDVRSAVSFDNKICHLSFVNNECDNKVQVHVPQTKVINCSGHSHV